MKKLATAACILLAGTLTLTGNAVKAGMCQLDMIGTCSLTEGDKTISNITITGGGFTPTSNQNLTFSIASGSWVVQTIFGPDQSTTQASTQANPIVLSYTLTINDPTKVFNRYTIQGDDNTLNGGNTSQTVNATNAPQLVSLDAGNPTPINGAFTGNNSMINVTSSIFTNGTTTFNSISQKFTQKDAPTQGVPAPLPLFGAGAAFGFSRRLRNRIKQLA